jgi:hypothetical protein
MRPERSTGLRLLIPCLLMISVMMSGRVVARTLWVEQLPWRLMDEERSLNFLADSFTDPETQWQMDSLGLATVMEAGQTNKIYLRWRYLSFSRAGTYAFTRWPDQAAEGVAETFPGEDRSGGWGRPEVGYLGFMKLPGLGDTGYALSGFLPFAGNELFPFAARSITLQMGVIKTFNPVGDLRLGVRGGLQRNMSASGDEIADEAFQSTKFWGLGISENPWRNLLLRLDYDVMENDGHASRLLTASLRAPLGEGQALEVGFTRDTAQGIDRYYSTRLFLRITVPLIPGDDKDDKTPKGSGGHMGEPDADGRRGGTQGE